MNELRTLLPEKLVNPTRAILQPSSRSAPEKLAAQLKDAAVTGSNEIQRFKNDYHSDAMRELFQKVNEAEISQGQDFWSTDYVGLVQKANARGNNPETSSEVVEKTYDGISDITAVEQFRDANPGITLKILDEASGMPLELTASPTTFHVSKSTGGSKSLYDIALKDSDRQSQLGKDVVKYVQTHHGDERLPILLVRQQRIRRRGFKLISPRACSLLTRIFEAKSVRSATKHSMPFSNPLSPEIADLLNQT